MRQKIWHEQRLWWQFYVTRRLLYVYIRDSLSCRLVLCFSQCNCIICNSRSRPNSYAKAATHNYCCLLYILEDVFSNCISSFMSVSPLCIMSDERDGLFLHTLHFIVRVRKENVLRLDLIFVKTFSKMHSIHKIVLLSCGTNSW